MSVGNEYNSLGQIMSSGGEIAVGLAKVHDWNSSRLEGLLFLRLKVSPGEDREELEQFADYAVQAGSLLSGLDPSDEIDLEAIPVNPLLFGDEPGGRRLHWEGEYRYGTEGEWWRISGDLPSLSSTSDILDLIAEAATANESTYRAKEGVIGEEGSELPEIRIVFAERRF